MSHALFPIRLKAAFLITPHVRHLVFESCAEAPFHFIPGQFVTLHFPAEHGQPAFHRSYSLANLSFAPDPDPRILEIAISRVPAGRATEILFELQPGPDPLPIQATGPFGRLVLPDPWEPAHRRLIWVATGTGVTPYRSMLPTVETMLRAQQLDRVVLLLGVREKAELLYGEDFLDFAKRHAAFHLIPCYSRETHVDLAAGEKRGYVQTHLPDLHPDPACDVVYLCGNPHMVDAAYASLIEQGFHARNVRREKYISSSKVPVTPSGSGSATQ